MKKIPSYVLVSSLSTGCSWLAGIQPTPYQAVSLWGVSWGQGEQEKKGGCNPPPLPSPSLHLSSLDLAQRSWDPWAAGAGGCVAVPHGRQHRLSQHLRSAHVCRKVSVSISPQPLPGYVFVHVCVFTALQTMKKDGSFQQ